MANKSKLNFIYHYPETQEQEDAIVKTLIAIIAESTVRKINEISLQAASNENNNTENCSA